MIIIYIRNLKWPNTNMFAHQCTEDPITCKCMTWSQLSPTCLCVPGLITQWVYLQDVPFSGSSLERQKLINFLLTVSHELPRGDLTSLCQDWGNTIDQTYAQAGKKTLCSHTSRRLTETIRRALYQMEDNMWYVEEEARQGQTSGTFFRKDLLDGVQSRANGKCLVKPNTGTMQSFQRCSRH